MAIQYSLSYDADGNPSLVKNTVQGSTPVIKSDFNIGAYEPGKTVSTDYEFTSSSDPYNEESQLQILKTYIAENDSDPNTISTGAVRNRDMLTAMDKDKMSRIEQFTGKQSAIDYEKYATRSALAGEIKSTTNILSLLTSNPINALIGTGARLVENYSDKQMSKLMDNTYASQEYQDYMKNLDYEYAAYQDYDVYNDYRGGPNYRDDKGYLDVRSGTVFDAEDEENNYNLPAPQNQGEVSSDSGFNNTTSSSTQSDRDTAGDAPSYSGPSPF